MKTKATLPRTKMIWDLHLSGMTNKEIEQELGVVTSLVASAVARGREIGVLPVKKFKSKADRRRRTYIRRGSVREIQDALSEGQQEWLALTAIGLGCDSIAEYLVELIRDVHEVDNERTVTTMTEMTLETRKEILANLIKEREELAAKYRGVRPSWVSTDLALLNARIDIHRAEVEGTEDQ